MARTPEGAALTEAHRRLQLRIGAASTRDLLRLWGAVDPSNLRGTVEAFARAGAVLVRGNRQASAVAAQRYYTAFRFVEGLRGAIAVTLPATLPVEVAEGTIRGAGIAGIQRARSRGATLVEAHANGFVKLSGSATSLVLGGGRETLLGAIRSDPEAHGWQRVTDGDPCAFCRMIASQGRIASDESSAGFEAHGHCGCTAEPFFEGSELRPDNARFRAEWDEATAGLKGSEALNAYRASLASEPAT